MDPVVHALLNHWRAARFFYAPQAYGTDTAGREVLSYVEGAPGDDAGGQRLFLGHDAWCQAWNVARTLLSRGADLGGRRDPPQADMFMICSLTH
jgi:hypothetical protein